MLAIVLRRHRPDVVALSASLDGRLDARKAAALDAHVTSCAACSAELKALRSSRDALRAVAPAEPPRLFRLTAGMVAAAPLAPERAPSMARWAPALGAAAVLVFAVLAGADLYSSNSSGSSSNGTAARSSRSQFEAPPSGVTAPQASSADKGVEPGSTPESASGAPPAPGALAPDATPAAGSGAVAPTATAGGPAASDRSADTVNSGNDGTATTGESAPAYGSAARQDDGDGDGGGNFWSLLRVIEAAVAAVALAAGAIAVAARLKERGASR